jgi:hypothetical protein
MASVMGSNSSGVSEGSALAIGLEDGSEWLLEDGTELELEG